MSREKHMGGANQNAAKDQQEKNYRRSARRWCRRFIAADSIIFFSPKRICVPIARAAVRSAIGVHNHRLSGIEHNTPPSGG